MSLINRFLPRDEKRGSTWNANKSREPGVVSRQPRWNVLEPRTLERCTGGLDRLTW